MLLFQLDSGWFVENLVIGLLKTSIIRPLYFMATLMKFSAIGNLSNRATYHGSHIGGPINEVPLYDLYHNFFNREKEAHDQNTQHFL